ncbi:MAG: PilZ domain-containing protein [Candidatus Sulfotelmatobacter sp.]
MDSINTRRWPRYPVHLPVVIAANSGAEDIVVPGLVSELSRAGMELYGGVNLQPGELMEVEFQTSGRVRVAGIVRDRSGFCFGLEFCKVRVEPEEAPEEESPNALESLILARHEAYLQEVQQEIDQSLQAVVEMRKYRRKIEVFANALDDWLKPRQG